MGQTASCVVQTAPTYLLSVYCEGNVSRPYGIFAWPKEGDVIKLSSFDFGLTEEEMRELLSPEKYVGRCAQQVEILAGRLRPLLEGTEGAQEDISV